VGCPFPGNVGRFPGISGGAVYTVRRSPRRANLLRDPPADRCHELPRAAVGGFENFAWWDFIAAPRISKTYQAYLGQGLTRSLVAMRAEESSTRTVGVTQWHLLYGLICPDRVFDRLLSGPASDVWIDPAEVRRGIPCTNARLGNSYRRSRVTSVAVDGGPLVEADFYIAALPVEVMAQLITKDLKRAAPSLANLDKLQTRRMNGIQFFLSQDVPVVNGHAIYLDSPWALTSISAAILDAGGLLAIGKRCGPRHPLGRYLGMACTRPPRSRRRFGRAWAVFLLRRQGLLDRARLTDLTR
jgi:hypothetical protein